MVDAELLPPLPRTIDVEPTIRCNLSCVMCQRTYWDRQAPDMSFDQFVRVYDAFPKLDYIKIQGVGEPLLNPELFDMIGYAHKHGSHVTTYTNGSLLHLHDNAYRLVRSGIDVVRISIDGGSKQTYESIRTNSNFEQLVSNLTLISKLRQGTSVPKVELWCVGLPQNMHEWVDMVDIAHAARIDTLHVQTILNTFDYREDVSGRLRSLLLQEHPLAASYLSQALAYAKSNDIKLIPFASKIYSSDNHCHRPFGSLFVSAEGLVVPCCTIADPSVINMGSIFEQDIEYIWRSVEYQLFRSSLLAGKLFRPCRNCYRESNRDLISSIKR